MADRHTILYAEDDVDDVYMVTKAFEAHDHIEVTHATDGHQALELLDSMISRGKKPCLIILDINMPGLNGKETLMRIRQSEETRELSIVLFSTSSSNTDKEFARQWGVELFTKPLHYSDLEDIARRFVDKCNFEINKLSTPN